MMPAVLSGLASAGDPPPNQEKKKEKKKRKKNIGPTNPSGKNRNDKQPQVGAWAGGAW